MMLFSAVVIVLCINVVSLMEEYQLYTKNCKIPKFEAFNEETNNIFNKEEYMPCGNKNLLTYTVGNKLYINKSAIREYYIGPEKIECSYQYVSRKELPPNPDSGFKLSSKQLLQDNVTLTNDTVKVSCFQENLQLYQNVHYVTLKIKKKEKTKPISVLIIAVDSISRLNLIRTMPSTRKYLLENDFIEMEAYHKIGSPTFSNFVGLLTGLNEMNVKNVCKFDKADGLNQCPMIWNHFRRLGFVTGYAEDWANLTTFNDYEKMGFAVSPTDHYYRPYIEASESLGKKFIDGMPFCNGPISAGERVLDLAKHFATTYFKTASFGIFWMNTFSHNLINTPSSMDSIIKNFYQDLKTAGIFNESIIFFLSDHGIRYGPIRLTKVGWFEERLPMNLIHLPPWFKAKYPKRASQLISNSKKLTSTFDLYMTLQDILKLSTTKYTKIKHPTGISLLEDIPINRSCEKAGIPETYCTCIGHLQNMNKDSNLVKKACLLMKKSYESTDCSIIIRADVSEDYPEISYLYVIAKIKKMQAKYVEGLFRVKNNMIMMELWIKLVYA